MCRQAAILTFQAESGLTYPPGHPFRPERSEMLLGILRRAGVLDEPWHSVREVMPATREELLAFHDESYLDLIDRADRGEIDLDLLEHGLGTEDCPAFFGVARLAYLAAGASLAGARLIAEGTAHLAFNPVGGFHHAGPANAEGFCYVNDVVLACRELAGRGLRVACVDLDVHHGNGTEDGLLGDPRVLKVSTHQDGRTLYPWRGEETVIGAGSAAGRNVNVPLPPGTDDPAFERVLRKVVLPVLETFGTDVVVLEIGMDVLAGDPLAGLRLTNNAMAEAAALIRDLGRPVLVLGGGGYDPPRTARGWALCWGTLCGLANEDEYLGAVGGVLLGTHESSGLGSLREMHCFAQGDERACVDAEVDRVIAFHEATTLPLLRGLGDRPGDHP
ncbi:MAG TPA: acetoin utilization protein AcuC [Polyangia bacterium]|nr:acetoin utilization protein AcuC [Polyangia bacterium]